MNKEKQTSSFKFVFGTFAVILMIATAFFLGRISKTWTNPFSEGVSATASCETAGAVLSTGTFTSGTEALFYLDSQSGRLSAGVLSRSEPSFVKLYTRQIKTDLAKSTAQLKIPMPADPRFIMVSGENDTKKFGAGEMNNLARSFVYIAEINTGIVLVYVLPSQGDRDLEVTGGEIYFWTFLRMNNGMIKSGK